MKCRRRLRIGWMKSSEFSCCCGSVRACARSMAINRSPASDFEFRFYHWPGEREQKQNWNCALLYKPLDFPDCFYNPIGPRCDRTVGSCKLIIPVKASGRGGDQ